MQAEHASDIAHRFGVEEDANVLYHAKKAEVHERAQEIRGLLAPDSALSLRLAQAQQYNDGHSLQDAEYHEAAQRRHSRFDGIEAERPHVTLHKMVNCGGEGCITKGLLRSEASRHLPVQATPVAVKVQVLPLVQAAMTAGSSAALLAHVEVSAQTGSRVCFESNLYRALAHAHNLASACSRHAVQHERC